MSKVKIPLPVVKSISHLVVGYCYTRLLKSTYIVLKHHLIFSAAAQYNLHGRCRVLDRLYFDGVTQYRVSGCFVSSSHYYTRGVEQTDILIQLYLLHGPTYMRLSPDIITDVRHRIKQTVNCHYIILYIYNIPQTPLSNGS